MKEIYFWESWRRNTDENMASMRFSRPRVKGRRRTGTKKTKSTWGKEKLQVKTVPHGNKTELVVKKSDRLEILSNGSERVAKKKV